MSPSLLLTPNLGETLASLPQRPYQEDSDDEGDGALGRGRILLLRGFFKGGARRELDPETGNDDGEPRLV